MSLIHNERTKYLATLVNTVAAACIVAGVVAPMAALTFGSPGPTASLWTVLISVVWLSTGFALHFAVRIILGRLRP